MSGPQTLRSPVFANPRRLKSYDFDYSGARRAFRVVFFTIVEPDPTVLPPGRHSPIRVAKNPQNDNDLTFLYVLRLFGGLHNRLAALFVVPVIGGGPV